MPHTSAPAATSITNWPDFPDITLAPYPGDLNGDGFVNLDDFIILAGNFGNDCND